MVCDFEHLRCIPWCSSRKIWFSSLLEESCCHMHFVLIGKLYTPYFGSYRNTCSRCLTILTSRPNVKRQGDTYKLRISWAKSWESWGSFKALERCGSGATSMQKTPPAFGWVYIMPSGNRAAVTSLLWWMFRCACARQMTYLKTLCCWLFLWYSIQGGLCLFETYSSVQLALIWVRDKSKQADKPSDSLLIQIKASLTLE